MKQIRICVELQAKIEEYDEDEGRGQENGVLQLVLVHLAVRDGLSHFDEKGNEHLHDSGRHVTHDTSRHVKTGPHKWQRESVSTT